MPYQLGLVDALKRFGLTVDVVPGWETRGDASFNPRGSVNHHTAGAAGGIRPSLALCTNGRRNSNGTWDLKGPLCNVFLDRNGVAVVVAAGRANHAGTGGHLGLRGNSSVFGTEAESTGNGLDWTDAQREAYPRVVAAFHWLMKQSNADTNCNHSTWTSRKIDCAGLSDGWFRERANALLREGGDTDMYTDADRDRDIQNSSVIWNILRQLGGHYDNVSRTIRWEGFTSFVDGKTTLTPVDTWRWIDKNVNDIKNSTTKFITETTGKLNAIVDEVKKLRTDVDELKNK